MVNKKLARLAGMNTHELRSPLDHHPQHEGRCAGMNDAEMREFFKEEQREGMHPSLKGKHF